ncbi:MAG: Rho termination factor N-terminal domain-containing protein [Thermodesulfobacteriota bacterium]|nr:Rho termination factor N-terminal domain-containing protein [Thermodesulfobacteriota bacterium]
MGKDKAKKGKPIEKMTATELREVAKDISEITGAHGMNKSELLDAIRKARGIEGKGGQKDLSYVRDLKAEIKSLKKERDQALQAKETEKATRLRRRISRLKKKTRRAAA